jgi:hypothetical protein
MKIREFSKNLYFYAISSLFTHFRIESANILLLCTLYTNKASLYSFSLYYLLDETQKNAAKNRA